MAIIASPPSMKKSCMEVLVLPECYANGCIMSPSGTVYNNVKLNLSQTFPDAYQILLLGIHLKPISEILYHSSRSSFLSYSNLKLIFYLKSIFKVPQPI